MTSNAMRVGNVEIVCLVDSQFAPPSERMFGHIPEALRRELVGETVPLTVSSFLVRSGGRTILVDTGIGPAGVPGFGIPPGRLLEALREAGVAPDAVDIVVNTHLHVDHIGWNTTGEGEERTPTFGKARYYIDAKELAAWKEPAMMEQAPIATAVLPLESAGVVETYDGETRLTEDLTIIPTPGHTPAHASIAIASGGEHAFILGDLAHHPMQVAHPEHCPAFDMDQEQARASRRAMWDRIEELGARVAAGHFPAPGFGRIVVTEGRRSWQVI